MKRIYLWFLGWLFVVNPALAHEGPDPWDYGANRSNSLDWYWYVIIVLGLAVAVLVSAWSRAEKERADELMKRRIEWEARQKAATPPP